MSLKFGQRDERKHGDLGRSKLGHSASHLPTHLGKRVSVLHTLTTAAMWARKKINAAGRPRAKSPSLGSPGAWRSPEKRNLPAPATVSSLVLTGCTTHGFTTFACFMWFPLQLSRSSWRITGFFHTLQCWNVANTCHRLGVWSVKLQKIFLPTGNTCPNYSIVLLCPIVAFDTNLSPFVGSCL